MHCVSTFFNVGDSISSKATASRSHKKNLRLHSHHRQWRTHRKRLRPAVAKRHLRGRRCLQ